jgi:NADH:ubiquinone oxidoreductase subunit E
MKKILVCVNYRANPDQPSCAARGSKELARCLEEELANHEISIKVEHADCLGYCDKGPNLKLSPEGRFFHHGSKREITAILSELKKFSLN